MATEKSAPAPAGRHQLGDLVVERKEALRLSYEKLAARCIDPEVGEQVIKGSWLHRIATQLPVLAPDVSQLRGLAVGLDVPLRAVQDAASAQFFGVDVLYSPDGSVRTALYHLSEMTEEDKAKVLAIIETFRKR